MVDQGGTQRCSWLDRPWTVSFSGKLGKMGPHENILREVSGGRKGWSRWEGNLLRQICLLPWWLTTHCLSPGNWNGLGSHPASLPHPTPHTRQETRLRECQVDPTPCQPSSISVHEVKAGCAWILLLLIFITQTVIKWNSAQAFFLVWFLLPPPD